MFDVLTHFWTLQYSPEAHHLFDNAHARPAWTARVILFCNTSPTWTVRSFLEIHYHLYNVSHMQPSVWFCPARSGRSSQPPDPPARCGRPTSPSSRPVGPSEWGPGVLEKTKSCIFQQLIGSLGYTVFPESQVTHLTDDAYMRTFPEIDLTDDPYMSWADDEGRGPSIDDVYLMLLQL